MGIDKFRSEIVVDGIGDPSECPGNELADIAVSVDSACPPASAVNKDDQFIAFRIGRYILFRSACFKKLQTDIDIRYLIGKREIGILVPVSFISDVSSLNKQAGMRILFTIPVVLPADQIDIGVLIGLFRINDDFLHYSASYPSSLI